MNLGEKITQLRKQKGLSQDALAHELNVSRQSISKWETGTSIPELEKLIALCNLFQISLDELVTDLPPQNKPPAPLHSSPPTHSTQHIIGLILLSLGILSTVLGLILLRTVSLLGIILIIYGAVFLLVKQHAGLIIGWLAMIPFLLLHRNYTGIRLFSVLNPEYYQNVAPMNCVIAWTIWLLLALLAYATFRAIKMHTKP